VQVPLATRDHKKDRRLPGTNRGVSGSLAHALDDTSERRGEQQSLTVVAGAENKRRVGCDTNAGAEVEAPSTVETTFEQVRILPSVISPRESHR